MRAVAVLLFLGILAAGAARGEEPLRPLDEVLKGRFLSLDGDRVRIRYDFSNPEEMKDFHSRKPFRAAGDLAMTHEDKAVRLKGTGSFAHRAYFADEVAIEFELRPWKDRDLGVVVMEHQESDQFVLYSLNDLHFQKFDGRKTPGHMITRFGIRDDSDAKGDHAFRYIARGEDPPIRKFETLRVKAEKKGVDDSMTIGDKTYAGLEMGRKLLDLHVGIYMVESEALVDAVIVSGRLSPRWIEENRVELKLSKPVGTEDAGSQADRTAREKLAKFSAGGAAPKELLDVVADPDVDRKIREEAAQLVIDSGDKSVAPFLVPLLYSTDLVVRDLGNDLVQKIVGRTFGYNPKADEEKRSAAIQKILKHIQQNASQFGGDR